MPDDVLFRRPELLWLVLLAPLLLAAYAAAFVIRRRALVAFGGKGARLVSRSAVRGWVKAFLLAFAVAALAAAVAGPEFGVTERAVTQQGADLVVALDVSQSMAARDVAPDRLTVARNVIDALGKKLVGGRAGLVLFAGDAVLRYPLTTEPAVLGRVLDDSARGFRLVQGSSLRAGVDAALQAFGNDERRRRRIVLVVSDGEDLLGEAPDLNRLRQRGVRVFALGIGTPAGAQIPTYDEDGKFNGVLRGRDGQPVTTRLDEERLRTIAEKDEGRYWRYDGSEAVIDEIAHLVRTLDTSEISKELAPADRYQWFLALALAALLLEWVIGERARMPRPRPLARPDRRAARAFGWRGG